MRLLWALIVFQAVAVVFLGVPEAVAQDPAPPAATGSKQASEANDEDKAEPAAADDKMTRLEKQLTGSVFAGRFTIDGKEGDLKEDRYELESVKKLPVGDSWLFKTRIKYGDHDVTVPLTIPIKWVDETPMIVIDQLTIPGLGTFDARVVLNGDRYAGTWQHDQVGGHMFGRIERAAEK